MKIAICAPEIVCSPSLIPPLTMASVDENCERLPPLHMNSFTVDDLARDDVPPRRAPRLPTGGRPANVCYASDRYRKW